jgi:HD superfamily phosphodiesterase
MEKYQVVWEMCKEVLQSGRTLDLVHARVSLDFALRLIDELNGDPEIVIPATILHDIGNTVLEGDDIEKKTIDPGTESAKKVYSTSIKKMHLIEGRKLAEDVLNKAGYPKEFIGPIVEIVGDHETIMGLPPDDREDINKLIVSEADKLYRFSSHGMCAMCRVHNIPEEEMLELALRNMDVWLVTDVAKKIALEELRKMPDSYKMLMLMEL